MLAITTQLYHLPPPWIHTLAFRFGPGTPNRYVWVEFPRMDHSCKYGPFLRVLKSTTNCDHLVSIKIGIVAMVNSVVGKPLL